MGALEKMVITGYKDETFSTKTGKEFTAMINPSSYDREKSVKFNKTQAINGGNASPYYGYDDETLKVKFTLDTTGVVPHSSGESLPDIIKKLEDTTYTYIGTTHQPPYIKIAWGTLSFQGRTKDFEVKYDFFAPSGQPLRAKVTLDIILYIPPKEQELKRNSNSPDLSHIITVKAGDTLPNLCREVYNSTIYCAEVARLNGLTSIREITPGVQLLFPPLSNY